MNKYGFVSKMTCPNKEKVQIQMDYWIDIFARGVKNLLGHKQQVPDVLITAASKWVQR